MRLQSGKLLHVTVHRMAVKAPCSTPGYCGSLRLGNCPVTGDLQKPFALMGHMGLFHWRELTSKLPHAQHPSVIFLGNNTNSHITPQTIPILRLASGGTQVRPRVFAPLLYQGTSSSFGFGELCSSLTRQGHFQNMQRTSPRLEQDVSMKSFLVLSCHLAHVLLSAHQGLLLADTGG